MKTRSMTDLISLLSAATGPSRKLDGDIALAMGVVPPGMERADDAWWGGGGKQWHAPEFTKTIDAALTLVPEDAYFNVERTSPGKFVETRPMGVARVQHKDGRVHNGVAETPAIALVIACLKAKEHSKP